MDRRMMTLIALVSSVAPGVLGIPGALAAPGATGATEATGDWPQWRGPDRSNVSAESGWTATGRQETVWSKVVGLGYSNIVVQDGHLVTVGFNEDLEKDVVFCLDPATGKEIWTQSYSAKKWAKYHGGGSNSTPSIDGERVYVFNRDGEFRCFKLADGEIIWKKDILGGYGVEQPTWGFAAAPLVLDDIVVVNAGRAIAFDKMSGKELWKTNDYGQAYATPVDFDADDRSMIALFTSYGLIVLDQTSGEEIAKYEWSTRYDVNAATPIIIGDRIFISSGYNHGCAMLRFDGQTLTPIWESKMMRNHMSGCVLINDHLYGFDETMLKCIDLDGNVMWEQRGFGKGALSGAGDKLIIASSKGELVVAEANPDGYKEVARADVLDGGVYWTTPVLVDGLIYIRSSRGEIACRDHRESTAKR